MYGKPEDLYQGTGKQNWCEVKWKRGLFYSLEIPEFQYWPLRRKEPFHSRAEWGFVSLPLSFSSCYCRSADSQGISLPVAAAVPWLSNGANTKGSKVSFVQFFCSYQLGLSQRQLILSLLYLSKKVHFAFFIWVWAVLAIPNVPARKTQKWRSGTFLIMYCMQGSPTCIHNICILLLKLGIFWNQVLKSKLKYWISS